MMTRLPTLVFNVLAFSCCCNMMSFSKILALSMPILLCVSRSFDTDSDAILWHAIARPSRDRGLNHWANTEHLFFPPPRPSSMEFHYEALSWSQLKSLCNFLGLQTDGFSRADLVRRLECTDQTLLSAFTKSRTQTLSFIPPPGLLSTKPLKVGQPQKAIVSNIPPSLLKTLPKAGEAPHRGTTRAPSRILAARKANKSRPVNPPYAATRPSPLRNEVLQNPGTPFPDIEGALKAFIQKSPSKKQSKCLADSGSLARQLPRIDPLQTKDTRALLLGVFRQLFMEDIAHCRLVCRRWHVAGGTQSAALLLLRFPDLPL